MTPDLRLDANVTRWPAYSPRKWSFRLRGEALICPRQHRLHTNAVFSEHGGMTCQHRSGGQGECGATVWLICIPGGLFLYEVTVKEMIHMRDAGMSAQECLSYLGGATTLQKAG